MMPPPPPPSRVFIMEGSPFTSLMSQTPTPSRSPRTSTNLLNHLRRGEEEEEEGEEILQKVATVIISLPSTLTSRIQKREEVEEEIF